VCSSDLESRQDDHRGAALLDGTLVDQIERLLKKVVHYSSWKENGLVFTVSGFYFLVNQKRET